MCLLIVPVNIQFVLADPFMCLLVVLVTVGLSTPAALVIDEWTDPTFQDSVIVALPQSVLLTNVHVILQHYLPCRALADLHYVVALVQLEVEILIILYVQPLA